MPERLPDNHLLDALASVFRTHGYAGTTLAMVSEATGLKKSSLYHRFPGGKEQMAAAVLEDIANHLGTHVLQPLKGTGSIRNRVKATAARIGEFYAGGTKACLLDTISIGTPSDDLADLLRGGYLSLIAAFSEAAREAGLPRRTAEERARQALVLLEGALVIARLSQNRDVFNDVIDGLPDLLCKP